MQFLYVTKCINSVKIASIIIGNTTADAEMACLGIGVFYSPASSIFCWSMYCISASQPTSTGILSSWLRATRSAPESTMRLMICKLPQAAAACNGVQPSTSRVFKSAPLRIRIFAISKELSMQHCKHGKIYHKPIYALVPSEIQ